MLLKEKVDFEIKRIYSLTETIKKLEPSIKEDGHAKRVLAEVLKEYVKVSELAINLIRDYVEEERNKGIVPLEYVRLYRKFTQGDK